MKKVVHLISDIGYTKQLSDLWTALHHSNIQLQLIYLGEQPLFFQELCALHGILFLHLSHKGLWAKLKAFLFLSNYWRKHQPDIIHTHLRWANILGLSSAFFARVPQRVMTRHHGNQHHLQEGILFGWASKLDLHLKLDLKKGVWEDRICQSLATHIVAPSASAKEVMVTLDKTKASKITLIPHGFLFDSLIDSLIDSLDSFDSPNDSSNLNTIQTWKTTWNLNHKYPIIGLVARYTHHKGIEDVIDAFAALIQKYPNAHLLLLGGGNGDASTRIQTKLSALPSNSYQEISFVQDMASFYGLLDIYVYTPEDAQYEAFGQTYIESLAANLPCIFTISGIAQDWLEDGVQAKIVPAKSPQKIAEALYSLLDQPEKAKEMAARGRIEVLDRFALDKQVAELLLLYELERE